MAANSKPENTRVRKSLTQERLKEVLHYDPETGVFTWRVTLGSRAKAGMTAARNFASRGYARIRIDNVLYRAHRLAWFYMVGEWPSELIDHRNRIRKDNQWENIRPATHSQNQWNRGRNRKSASGLKGVFPSGKRWLAKIVFKGEPIKLGSFDDPEDAHKEYVRAAEMYHREFARSE